MNFALIISIFIIIINCCHCSASNNDTVLEERIHSLDYDYSGVLKSSAWCWSKFENCKFVYKLNWAYKKSTNDLSIDFFLYSRSNNVRASLGLVNKGNSIKLNWFDEQNGADSSSSFFNGIVNWAEADNQTQITLSHHDSIHIRHKINQTNGNNNNCAKIGIKFYEDKNKTDDYQHTSDIQSNSVLCDDCCDICLRNYDTGFLCTRQPPYNRWYYDHNENRCLHLTYMGCGGTQNNFNSLIECNDRCVKVEDTSTTTTTTTTSTTTIESTTTSTTSTTTTMESTTSEEDVFDVQSESNIELPHSRVKRVDPDVESIEKGEEISKKIKNIFNFNSPNRAEAVKDFLANKYNITKDAQNEILTDVEKSEEMNWLAITINKLAQKTNLVEKVKNILNSKQTIDEKLLPTKIKDQMVESIKSVFSDLMHREKKDISDFINAKENIKDNVNEIKSEAKEIGETMVDYVSSFFDKMEQKISSKFTSLLFDMEVKHSNKSVILLTKEQHVATTPPSTTTTTEQEVDEYTNISNVTLSEENDHQLNTTTNLFDEELSSLINTTTTATTFSRLDNKEKKDISDFLNAKENINSNVNGIKEEAKEIGETMVDYVSDLFDKVEGTIGSHLNSLFFDVGINRNKSVIILLPVNATTNE